MFRSTNTFYTAATTVFPKGATTHGPTYYRPTGLFKSKKNLVAPAATSASAGVHQTPYDPLQLLRAKQNQAVVQQPLATTADVQMNSSPKRKLKQAVVRQAPHSSVLASSPLRSPVAAAKATTTTAVSEVQTARVMDSLVSGVQELTSFVSKQQAALDQHTALLAKLDHQGKMDYPLQSPSVVQSQDPSPSWTPEEQKEQEDFARYQSFVSERLDAAWELNEAFGIHPVMAHKKLPAAVTVPKQVPSLSLITSPTTTHPWPIQSHDGSSSRSPNSQPRERSSIVSAASANSLQRAKEHVARIEAFSMEQTKVLFRASVREVLDDRRTIEQLADRLGDTISNNIELLEASAKLHKATAAVVKAEFTKELLHSTTTTKNEKTASEETRSMTCKRISQF